MIAAIRARGAGGARDRKLALVVEGGGLRGICSGAGAVALEHMGLTSVFDEVYGTSAGAMNAAYFLAGQAALGMRIYLEDMVRREVVSLLRFWRIFDIDWLFTHVITGSKPLRLDRVLASPSRLHISLLDAAAGTAARTDTRALTSIEALLTALKASTALPVLFNRRFDVDGRPCMDAGIVNPIPIESAIADGATDILVLLSRPEAYRRAAPGRATRWIFDWRAARGNATLSEAFANQFTIDARQRALALGKAPAPAGVRIATIAVDEGDTVERLTTDPRRLHAAAVAYGRKTLRIFGAEADAWTIPPPT
ncbi:MAG TPA: patatin-like phospholipase family protein [Polyangia bacterium]|nr:patatin-like phospholipase family protein [Polyangia bacterium]